MYQKKLNIWAFLLIGALILAGCGGGGSSGSGITSTSTTNDGKTASVYLSFAFPPGDEVQSAVISDATTHILVNVKQWTTDDLNNLRVVNTDKALLTKDSPSTTIDLLPTYTRICASQYKGDPNSYITSQILETACTFGKLDPGTNTVTLTMIRGEWTLQSPLTLSDESKIESVALNRGGLNPSTYHYKGCYDPGTDVLDGLPMEAKGPFDMPAQALNNWGSIYQAMFKKDGAYRFLEHSGAGYTNFFNTAEPNLLIAAGEEILPKPTNPPYVRGFVIGGFGKATDTDNVYRQKKQIINYVKYRTAEPEDIDCNCRYEGDWDGRSWYKCYKPVLFTTESELRIYDNNGQLITKDFVDQCQLKITDGNKIEGCAGTETSVSGTKGTEGDYDRKVTVDFIFKGADICFRDDKQAAKDENGNIICYNYEYSWQPVYTCYTSGMTFDNSSWRCESPYTGSCPSGSYYDSQENVCYNYDYYTSGYTYTCWDGGTYNTQTNRCEMSLEQACYGSEKDPNEDYDPNTQTCTETGTGYFKDVVFNLTPVTLNGVGELPSSMTYSTSNVKNKLKW